MIDFNPDEALQDNLKAWTDRISAAVHLLYQWNVLHYTGHFLDCDPHVKGRIDGVNIKTEEILKSFGYIIHSTATTSPTKGD